MKTVEEIALSVCEKIGPVAMCKDPLAFSEMVVAAVDAERGEDAVAWVDVVDRHEGPYKFQGKELLDSGKHNLYTTPQPCQRCAGKDQLIAEQNKLGKERQEWALKNAETIRELKTKCADLEQMHADICEIADDYRGKWLDLEALVTAENQRKQQLEAAIERMRISGGKDEFQKAFDDAKGLI